MKFKDIVKYEICDNPDHAVMPLLDGDTVRLGCPLCGHNDKHRIKTTAYVTLDDLINFLNYKLKTIQESYDRDLGIMYGDEIREEETRISAYEDLLELVIDSVQ